MTDRIDGRVLSRAGEQLRLIAHFGAGVDNIDVATAVQRGITVTNTPGVLTKETADMTMALILAVPRRMIEGVKIIEQDKFTGWSPTWMMGRRIWGTRLGIIGMGRIGQAVRAGPRRSACKSIITTAARPRRTSCFKFLYCEKPAVLFLQRVGNKPDFSCPFLANS